MGTGIYKTNNKFSNFDGKRDFRLGSAKHPIHCQVQSEEKRDTIEAACKEHKWACEIVVDPEQPEDVSQYEEMLNKPKPRVNAQKIGRNEPCTCGSGRKFKKCCG